MNLIKVQEDFINLIKNNYKEKYELSLDFIDLDKFKNDFTIFVEFEGIKPKSNLSDDCSEYGELKSQVYLVIRNDTSSNLKSKILNATSDIFNILINDDIKVEGIEFYNYVSGTKYITASEFDLKIDIET